MPRHHCIVIPTQTCQAGLFERCNSHRGSPLGHPKTARQFGAGAGGRGAARRINRWQASLSDLIEAYVSVKRRAMTARSSGLQGRNGDFAEICPQNPVERVERLSAPLPIGRSVLAL